MYTKFTAAFNFLSMTMNLEISIVPYTFFCSDGVLNPNGVRFGSAEIYNVGKIKKKILFVFFRNKSFVF